MSDTECSWCNHSAGRLRGRARNGKPQQMLFLSSLRNNILLVLQLVLTQGKDTNAGEYLLLRMDWFCCKTLAFHRKGVQSCLLSGH